MKSINWKVTVWLNCEQRIGKDEEKRIKKRVFAYAQSHKPELSPFQLYRLLHKIDNNKKWPRWYLYCYFIVKPQPIVDVADTAPIQSTKQGETWLKLIDMHFDVFGMPWRMREFEYTYGTMISGGENAVECLKKSISAFIQGIEVKSDVRNHFNSELKRAEERLNGYYTAMNIEEPRQAIVTLDHAVYILHELIFDVGEELGFIPPKIL